GVKFDRRNFQRKILSSGVVESSADYAPKVLYDSPEYSDSEAESACYADLDMCAPISDDGVERPEPSSLNEYPRRVQTSSAPGSGRKGRHGILFRFNREKYDELKEDGLKQEF
ncbi:MAG: hypothetical protein IK076_00070, partial [Bacteroidales bacterium]|nr:hypothetical protein [Bacteroidales bacterium]